MYRVYSIRVKKEDFERADAIMLEHLRRGDLDDLRYSEEEHRGYRCATFWINPLVNDDLDVIEAELKKEGIELL